MLPPERAVHLLRAQWEKGKQLLAGRPITSAAERTWETVTREVLVKAFGENSPNVGSVMDVGKYAFAFGSGNEAEWERQRAVDMETRLSIIDGLIELLESEINYDATQITATETARFGDGVFVVHGHDEAVTHETARFLQNLGLKLTILREQPNSGRAIIEKYLARTKVTIVGLGHSYEVNTDARFRNATRGAESIPVSATQE